MKTTVWSDFRCWIRTIAIAIAAGFLSNAAEIALTQEPQANHSHEDLPVEKIELRSYPLATPMTFPGDSLGEKITSFQIKGEAPRGEVGSARLLLNPSALKFNEFGDAENAEVRPPRAITVALIRHCREAPNKSLFEISSPELKSQQTVMLLLNHDDPKSGYLLIGTIRPENTGGSTSLSLVETVPLHSGAVREKNEVPQPKLRDDIVMYSGQHPRVVLQGRLGSDGTLMHDKNQTGLDWSNSRIMRYSTAAAFPQKPLTMESVELPDPLDQGRRLFKLAFAAPSELGEIFLAVAPAAAGPHRLIIREGGKTTRVLPLIPDGIEPWAKLQTAFSELPSSEQNAITRLSDAASTNFFHDYFIRTGHVIYISLSRENANGETLAQLRYLPQLFDLHIQYSDVPPDVLASVLIDLNGVTSLELRELRFTEDLMEAIGKLPNLESLTLANTPETPLTNESLRRISAGATRLRELDLAAFGPTDEGLLHLAKLPSLEKLRLHAPQASEEGLKRLKDSLPNCTTTINP
jgi:hypothetical protein